MIYSFYNMMNLIHIIKTFIYLHHNLVYIIILMDLIFNRLVKIYCLFFQRIFNGLLSFILWDFVFGILGFGYYFM